MTDHPARLRAAATLVEESSDLGLRGTPAVCRDAADEIERLVALLRASPCPGGGYTGQPATEAPTVQACLDAGVCGCIFGERAASR